MKIVSDGFDRVVGAALQEAGLSVPFFANKLEWQGGDRWRLAFPHAQRRLPRRQRQLQVLARASGCRDRAS